MPIHQPDAFLVPRNVVTDHLAKLTPEGAKMLLFMLEKAPWSGEAPYVTVAAAATLTGLPTAVARESLRELQRHDLLEYTTKYGFRLNTAYATSRHQSGEKKSQPAKLYNVILIYNIVSNTKILGDSLRSKLDDPSVRVILGKDPSNTATALLRGQGSWLEPVAANPLLADLSVPLRVRVQNALASLNPDPSHSSAVSGAARSKGKTDLNPYRAQIKLIRALWKLLWGDAALPDSSAVASMISRYGGYRNGGASRLAMEMLKLAAVDTNPLGLLMAQTKSARVGYERTVSQYKDWTDEEVAPERGEMLDV